MYIILGIRRCDQKDQADRFPIQRVKFHAFFYHHRRKPRTVHRAAFSVRNGNPLSDSRRALFLSCIHLPAVGFLVVDPSALYHKLHGKIQGFVFAFGLF